MTETPAEEQVEPAPPVQPISPIDDMNKQQLWAHIERYHSVPYAMNSKTAKEAMLEHHAIQHSTCDFTHYSPEAKIEGYSISRKHNAPDGRSAVHPRYMHEHLLTEISEDQRVLLEKVQSGTLGKMLSAPERKSLKELVDNDFGQLKAQMRQFAADTERSQLAGLEAEFESKVEEAQQWQRSADVLREKHQEQQSKLHEKQRVEREALVERAKERGIQVTYVSNVRPIEVTVPGLEEARSSLKRQIQEDLSRALLTLERQRLAAQRTILMSGVSPEGLALLDTIPTAQELMLQAAQEQAPKELTG